MVNNTQYYLLKRARTQLHSLFKGLDDPNLVLLRLFNINEGLYGLDVELLWKDPTLNGAFRSCTLPIDKTDQKRFSIKQPTLVFMEIQCPYYKYITYPELKHIKEWVSQSYPIKYNYELLRDDFIYTMDQIKDG